MVRLNQKYTPKDRAVYLYIVSILQKHNNMGATHLNKILFYSDCALYRKKRNKITSFSYIKQENGPTPAPIQILSLRDDLLREGMIHEDNVSIMGVTYKRLSLNNEVIIDLDLIRPEEISIIDEVVQFAKQFSATGISKESHNEIGWQQAEMMQEIPDYVFLLTKTETPTEKYEEFRKIISEHNVRHNSRA